MNWNNVLPVIAAYTPALIAIGLGLMVNNKRIDDLRQDIVYRFENINHRFANLEQLLMANLTRVEQVLDARLSHIEEKLETK